jgi:multiple sugar transport system substrate-binding protein
MKRMKLLFFLTLVFGLVIAFCLPVNAADKKPFEGVTINVGVLGAGMKGAISSALYKWREDWENMTGAKLNIIEVPIAQIREKILTDLTTGAGGFDGFDGPVWLMGDLVKGDYLVPIDQWINDPRFPKWHPEDVVEPQRPIHFWKGVRYLASNDYDCHTLIYRKDILTDPKWQAAFKQEKGYAYSVPPRTWEELADIAEFFNGKDWNGDGKPDHGISQSWKKGEQAMWHFFSLASAYMIVPGATFGKVADASNSYWFDPADMRPLINEPGFVRAMEMAVRLYKAGSPAQSGWGLGEMWGDYLAGNAIFNYGYGDHGALCQEQDRSKVKGKNGFSILPGTKEVWNAANKQWVKMQEPNLVVNTIGPSWSIFIFKQSKHPEVVYHLAAFHAQRDVHFWNVTHGYTGINVGTYTEFLNTHKEHPGQATIEDWVKAGWDKGDAEEYENAFYENYFLGKVWLPNLRIPGTFQYVDALDEHLQEAITGQASPKEALDRTASDWNDITEQLGKDQQLQYFRDDVGFGQ